MVAFCRYLVSAGIPAAANRASEALRSLEAVDVWDRTDFYYALRLTLASSPWEQVVFDDAFRRFWGAGVLPFPADALGLTPPGSSTTSSPGKGAGDKGTERRDSKEAGQPVIRAGPSRLRSALSGDQWETEGVQEASVGGYSPLAQVYRRDFSEFAAEELPEVLRLAQWIGRRLATRKGRWRPQPHGRRFHLSRTWRRSLQYGGEPVDPVTLGRRPHRLDLVVLCDTSRSMAAYAPFLIQFLYGLYSAGGRVHLFGFNTRLTPLTPALRAARAWGGLPDLRDLTGDWTGGTRIGECFQQFWESYGHLLRRWTVLVILSDGWDTGSMETLEAVMGRFRRRAARILWLNPLMATPGYAPTCRAMQVALPYLDLVAPANNLASLRRLARTLASLAPLASPAPSAKAPRAGRSPAGAWAFAEPSPH